MLDEMMTDEIKELANVIFHEARGESRTGQVAVGHVVMNRLRSGRWGKTVREVVWAPRQFTNLRRYQVPLEFLALARDIYEGKVGNPVGNAMFFASNGRGKGRIRIGNHRFW